MQAGKHPGYYTLAIMLALLALGLGIAYTPWMASFTETVEDRNPALIATGLAIWGWIIRVVVFLAFLLIPRRDQLGHAAGELRRHGRRRTWRSTRRWSGPGRTARSSPTRRSTAPRWASRPPTRRSSRNAQKYAVQLGNAVEVRS